MSKMDIREAVNIGPKLATDLRRAGIDTLEALRALGVREAWLRLQAAVPDRDCTHSCMALAGAIQGVRWTGMPAAERKRIMEEIQGPLIR